MSTQMVLKSRFGKFICLASFILTSFTVFAESTCQPFAVKEMTESPFALHAAYKDLDDVEELGVTMVRKMLVWGLAVTADGKIRYHLFDKMLQKRQRNGIHSVISLSPTAYTQNPLQQTTDYPQDMSSWLRFVRSVVERYDGDGYKDMDNLSIPIRYWQITNEWEWQWTDSVEKFVRFIKETAQAIKQADQDAIIILGAFGAHSLAVADGFGFRESIVIADRNRSTRKEKYPENVSLNRFVNHPRFKNKRRKVETVLKKAAPFFDIIDLHTYTEDPLDTASSLCWLRNKMQEYGYKKPIWSMENAGPFYNFSIKRFSEDVVKRHMIGISYGLDRIFWSSLNPTPGWPENFLRLALITKDGRKTPAFYTYKLMMKKLGGIRQLETISMEGPVAAFRARLDEDKIVYIAWSRSKSNAWVVPQYVTKAKVTHILTQWGQTDPDVDYIASNDGKLSVRLNGPVFIEPVD